MGLDFKDFGLAGAKKDDVKPDGRRRWWACSGAEAADAVTANLKFLMDHQSARMAQLVMSARLYGNFSLLGLNGMTYATVANVHPSIKERISYNLIQSCVDAITSKMAKNKPRTLFLTNFGDHTLQARAKKLNQYNDGVFWENKATTAMPMAFRDAAILGDGITHVYDKDGSVAWERVLPSELWVDETEGFYGEPRSLHRVKNIDKDVMADAFPGAKRLLSDANKATNPESADGSLADMVTVRESWHLPSGPNAKDGKRIITIAEGEILSEPWTHPVFPFPRIQWSRRIHGFWGQGLAEQLQNLQLEINKLLFTIQRSMHLAGSFKVFLHTTAKVVNEHINNELGTIVRWSGNIEPKYATPPIVQPEIYQHLSTLISRGFEQSGISMLSAASQKPAGLDSGKALRTFNDIESDRFMTLGQSYEAYALDLSAASIYTTKDIEEAGGKPAARAPGQKFIHSIKWKDVDLDESQYVMQSFPVSSLPQEPAGRVQTLTEWAQAGIIEQDEIRPLSNMPDLNQSDNLYGASREWLTKVLDDIVEEGEYRPPEGFDNLQLAFSLAQKYYAQGKLQALPEERLEMLRRFMGQAQDLMTKATAPVGPQAPPPGAPQAVPAQPPVSDLLPNAPAGAA